MSSIVSSAAAPRFPVTPGLPTGAGIGFKPEHASDLEAAQPALAFLEVHAENYMGAGGWPHALLTWLRERYALSLHGVGLSIGGQEALDEAHIDRLAQLMARYQPQSFSEHLAWSSHDEMFFNDLLPVAYDTATLNQVVSHIHHIQERLGCRMLLENPSSYVEYAASSWDEIDFIAEVARRSGCGLLLDVNNVQVTCVNHGRDPCAYIDAFPVHLVGEIHLAGYAEEQDSSGARLLIDAHDRPVSCDVWSLFRQTVRRAGPLPTLIEWDNDVPPLDLLLKEARKAEGVMTEEAQRLARSMG